MIRKCRKVRFAGLSALIGAALLTVAATSAPSQQPLAARNRPAPDAASTHIVLHSGCDSMHSRTCSSYTIEVFGDGRVVYNGHQGTFVLGRRSGRIVPVAIKALERHAEAAKFWSFPTRSFLGNSLLHSSQRSLKVTIAGKSKEYLQINSGSFPVDAESKRKSNALIEAAVDRLRQDVFSRSGAERWVSGNAETAPTLEAEGFDFKSTEAAAMLAEAVEAGKTEVALDFLAAGAPLSRTSPEPLNRRRSRVDGRSAMEAAVARGNVPLIHAMMASDQFRSLSREEMGAVLACSVRAGSADLVKALFEAGADVDAISSNGQTPLTEAQWLGTLFEPGPRDSQQRLAMTALLLQRGADPNKGNKHGDRPLHYARDAAVVSLLVQSHADLELRNSLGQTPVLRNGNDEAVAAMIEAGADYTAVGSYSYTRAPGAFIRSAEINKLSRSFELVLSKETEVIEGRARLDRPIGSSALANFYKAVASYLNTNVRHAEAERFTRAIVRLEP